MGLMDGLRWGGRFRNQHNLHREPRVCLLLLTGQLGDCTQLWGHNVKDTETEPDGNLWPPVQASPLQCLHHHMELGSPGVSDEGLCSPHCGAGVWPCSQGLS